MKRLLLVAATLSLAGCDFEGAYQRLVDKHNGVNPAVPNAPTAVSAVAGNASAVVSWTAPTETGTGGPITGYTVTSTPGGFTATTTGETTATVTGLVNGTAYTFTVRATNAAGDGPESLPSIAVTPATVPGAPTDVTGIRGNGEVTVSWIAPASNGGSAITGYRVIATPGSVTVNVADVTTAVVGGLTNGVAYTFTVFAINAVGVGPESAPSVAITPAEVPGAPTLVTATAGNAQATVTWTAPANTGGGPIIDYQVTADPGGQSVTVTGTTGIVTGLTNGTAYSFTVRARNVVGLGSPSAASNTVTPATVPDAPTAVVATGKNASADVSWTAPANTGGLVITGYTVTSNPDNRTATTTGATTATVTGLTNGVSYTFTVVATNAIGDSTPSSASSAITPSTVPGAPANVVGTRGNQQVTVTWDAPSFNGGAAITGYTVTSNPDNRTATSTGATTATVTGLTNGTAYTFTVVATNQNGDGIPSMPSASVTPATVPNPPTNVTGVSGNQQVTVTWNAPTNNGGSPVTGYTVTSNPGSAMAMTSTTSAVVTGLTNGTAYTFRVVATNAVGNSNLSSPSSAITPATVPGAPTNVVAVAKDEAASISFTAPASNGGAAVTSYVVTSNPGGLTATFSGTSGTFEGLTNGTAYTFTVAAKNIVGTGASSSASNSVTPVIMPDVLSASVTGVGGCMTVDYNLYQRQYARADVLIEVDPGTGTFRRATQAGTDNYEYTGTRALFASAAFGGETRKFLWNSSADLPMQRATNVRIRVSASHKGVTGITQTTAPFVVDNTIAFGSPAKVDAGSAASDLVVADFNRDGRPDIVAAESQTQAFSVLLTQPDGGLSPATYYSTGAVMPSGLAHGDFDRDGKPDLLVALGGEKAFAFRRGNGDGTFQAATAFDAGFGNGRPVAADFNGDNKLDFVSTSSGVGGGGYQVFLGQGNGTFVPSTIRQAVNTVDLAVEDFNQDGKPDVAGINSGTLRVEILLGAGDGTLAAPVSYVAGNGVKSLATGDFNHDGRVDIATANGTGGTASVLLSNGPGTFANPASFSIGAGVNHVHASDLDRDGHLDLLFSFSSPSSWVAYKGVGDGTFGTPTTIAVVETLTAPKSARTADLNGDGTPEIIAADYFPHLRIIPNMTALSCGSTISGPIAAETLPTVAGVAVGEVDADGRVDVIVASQSSLINASWLHKISGLGDGRFEHTSQGNQVSTAESVALGDFNGDSILDVASTSPTFGVVTVARGLANSPQFNNPTDSVAGSSPRGLVVVDLDRDGKLDVVSTDSAAAPSQALNFLRGQGTLSLAARKTYPAGAGATGITTADFDLDGWADIATANSDAGTISVVLGAGDGGLSAPAHRSVGSRPVAIGSGDLNADGRPDLAVADSATNAVYTFLATATGWPTSASATYAVGTMPVSIAVADFTGDGLLDIATADSAGETVTLLTGQAGGTFAAAKSYRAGPQPVAVAAGDINDDGRMDLVVANKTSGIVTTLLSVGAAGFAADLASVSVASFPQAALSGDFNGDGAADVAVTSNGSAANDQVCVALSSGTTLTTPVNYDVQEAPDAIARADLNRDGKLDLVVANKFSESVSVLLGLGNGTFQTAVHTALPSSANASSLTIADFDLDGWPDVAAGNSALGTISILRGTGTASLTAGTQLTVVGSPQKLAAGDFNRDGAPDLLSAENGGSGAILGLYVNNRAGGFLARQAITMSYGTVIGLASADFNRDGLLDIALLQQGNGGLVSIIPATATGFDMPVDHTFWYSTTVYGLDVTDFNRDGWPDLAVGVQNGLLAVLVNRGGTDFERHRTWVRSDIRDVAAGDVNRDGKADVFAIGQGSGRIEIVPGK